MTEKTCLAKVIYLDQFFQEIDKKRILQLHISNKLQFTGRLKIVKQKKSAATFIKKLRDVLQERKVASLKNFLTILSMLNHFLNLSRSTWSVSIYLDLFCLSSGYLDLFQFIIVHIELSWAFLYKIWYYYHLGLFQAILDYHWLSQANLHTCILA